MVENIGEDTLWSEISPEPDLETKIQVVNGAKLTLDVPGEVQSIEVFEGTFEMETIPGRSFSDPTLNFADDPYSGLIIQDGQVIVRDTASDAPPPEDPDQEEILKSMTEPRETVVIRNDHDVRQKSIELAKNRWFFLPQSLEWSLHNYHLLETYNTYPMITYWEARDGQPIQRTVTFDHGITEMKREKDIDLHKNTVDGGSEIQLTYDRADTKEWGLAGIFNKRYSGKAKMKELYHLADTLQRDSPVLLVTDETIKYVMVKSMDHEVGDNFYKWGMVVEEQKYPTADRLETETETEEPIA